MIFIRYSPLLYRKETLPVGKGLAEQSLVNEADGCRHVLTTSFWNPKYGVQRYSPLSSKVPYVLTTILSDIFILVQNHA